MIVFFSLFSVTYFSIFYNLGHYENKFLFLVTVRSVCLTNVWVLSVPQRAVFSLVWAKGVSHWGTTGEIIMLELITFRQVGPKFLNSLPCKIPRNAKKSYDHPKIVYLFQTFRWFRNRSNLGASSCGFIPSELKHVIVIGGSVQCLFVLPEAHNGSFLHLAVIISVIIYLW